MRAWQVGLPGPMSSGPLVAADRPDFTEAWKTRVRGDSSATPERPIALRRADGSELSVRVSSVLVRDTLGAPRYVVARAVCTQN